MSTDGIKPRRVVRARRVLALGASAAVLGAASGAAPMTPTWITPKSLVHQVDAEGEGDEAPVEAEGEAESGGVAESEGGEGGEGTVSAEGESEGGDATAESSDRSGTLVVIGGLLRAAEALRAAGYPEAGALVEEAAEAAEHGLDGALAEELYEAIEALEDAQGTEGFAGVQDRLATALAGEDAADRLEALPPVLRQAGGAYAEAVADGAVTDRTEYLEALGFYQAVGAELEALSGAGDANLAEVVAMMQASLEDAAPAFGGLSGEGIATPDASLIYGAAARMELAALRLR